MVSWVEINTSNNDLNVFPYYAESHVFWKRVFRNISLLKENAVTSMSNSFLKSQGTVK